MAQAAFHTHFASTISAEYTSNEELYNCMEQFLAYEAVCR